MTREEFEKKVHWSSIYWAAMVINVTAMLPQIVELLRSESSKNVSSGMVLIYLATQLASAVEGWVRKSRALMIGMLCSAALSGVTLWLINHYSAD